MDQEISQKQLSITEIMSRAWKIFKENFKTIATIVLIIYIPINIILFYVPVEDTLEGMRSYFRVIQLFESLIGIIATIAIALVVKSKMEGNVLGVKEALKQSLSKWGVVVGTNILLGIFLVGLTLLLIVPGIIYFIFWLFVTYTVVFNNKSGKAAMNYSKEIVSGRWGIVFGYFFVFGLFGLLLGIIVAIPSLFLPTNLIISVISDTSTDIIASFFSVVWVIFYLNFEATKRADVSAEKLQEIK